MALCKSSFQRHFQFFKKEMDYNSNYNFFSRTHVYTNQEHMKRKIKWKLNERQNCFREKSYFNWMKIKFLLNRLTDFLSCQKLGALPAQYTKISETAWKFRDRCHRWSLIATATPHIKTRMEHGSECRTSGRLKGVSQVENIFRLRPCQLSYRTFL